MANYPLITGNSNEALDAITTDAVGIQKISLTNSVNGKLDQYIILTIKSLGDVGTNVDITKISTVDENDIDSDSLLSDTGNGFVKQKNSEYQSRLFTISPLEKTDATTWVQEAPFIGVVDSNYDVEQRHTASWATGSGDHAVPSATVLQANTASSYCIINSAGEALELNATNTYAAAIAAGHSIVPLHNHQYIIENNIPKGQYANFLIRASATVGFDTNITHKLLINHNANVLYADTSNNFEINLNASSVNIFQLVAEFNSNSITPGADLGARYSTMNFIPTNEVTGNSWRYDHFALPGMDYAADEFSLPLAIDGTTATANTQLNNANNTISSWGLNLDKQNTLAGLSQMFITNMRVYDNSFVKQLFEVKQTGSLLENIQYNDNRQEAGTEFVRTIKHNNSSYTTDGEIKQGDVVYFSSPSSNGVYTNFNLSDIKFDQSESIEVKIDDDKIEDIDYTFSTGVYSLYTYHADYAEKNGTVDNYSVTPNSSTSASLIPHVSDSNIKFKGTTDKLTGVAQHPMYTWAYGNYSKGLTEHNVTINTLETQDLIDFNGLSSSGLLLNEQLYCKDSNIDVSVKVAASDSSLAPRTDAAVASTVVPNVANPNKHYTIYADAEMPEQTISTLDRNGNGVYSSRNTEGHLELDIEFRGAKTSWQPGGVAYGTNRVPWFHLCSDYKLKTAYNAVRPLINFTYDVNKCDVHEITRLEFYGIPDLRTATTTNILDGVVDFGTQSFTETSRTVLITAGSDSLTHKVAADTDRQSYVVGMEVKGLVDYFPGRNFIGEVITHASNATIIKLVQEGADGQAGTTASVSTAATDSAGITVEICKPTQKVNFTRDNYPYTTLGDFEERARVQKTYGSDLSYYNPNIDPIDLKVQDRIVNTAFPLSELITQWNALFAEDVATAVNHESVVTSAAVANFNHDTTVVNYSPKEKSITYNTAEIPSERYYSQDYNTDVYLGEAMAMYYKTILLPVEGVYSHTMDFFLTNLGLEDVIFNSAKLVDPVYLPENVYQLKPHNSTAPTWSLEHNVTVDASVLSNSNTPVNTKTKEVFNISSTPETISRSESVHRRMKKYAGEIKERIKLSEFKILGNDDNKLSVNFSVASNTNVAGDYYKCLEIHYVRDIGPNQLYTNESSSALRTYGQQGIWVMRKLIKISITTENKISVTDVDNSTLGFNADIDFTVQV